ncbi:MAG TPA: peptidylprolyl isomerase [Rhizomicrobium sp.]|jgi:peptidylprolyl isomerase|nr:peptidylprolyl isomerase [Rhizomicrobium sp.]
MHRAIHNCTAVIALAVTTAAAPSMNDILAHAPKQDWRTIDPANTLVMALPRGRVTIELAPLFAPNTIANIKTLVRAHYFEGSAIVRAQDNYVVQWSRMDSHPLGAAKKTIAAEFDRSAAGVPFTAISDLDTYARETGFSSGFPAARESANGRIWLAHCYGMVGVGRDVPADSGNGSELYAVIGQSPRNLDRNVTLVGRVIEGIELLSAIPRGTGPLGFYEKPGQRIPIAWIRLGSELPSAERPKFEALKTDSPAFSRVLEERRTRPDPWYKHSPGRISVCNMPLPVRRTP